MKVLKHVPWTYNFWCSMCKSNLEAEPADVMYTDYEEAGEWYVKCAVCEEKHVIDPARIPRAVQFEAVRFCKTPK